MHQQCVCEVAFGVGWSGGCRARKFPSRPRGQKKAARHVENGIGDSDKQTLSRDSTATGIFKMPSCQTSLTSDAAFMQKRLLQYVVVDASCFVVHYCYDPISP